MKKIYAIIAVAVSLFAANQTFAQVSVHAGYVNNHIISSRTVINTTVHDTTSNPGLYLGVAYNYAIKSGFCVSVGANVEYYHAADTVNLLELVGVTSKFTELDLVVPILLNYGFDLGSAKLTVFGGPTINFGLVNKTDYHFTSILGVNRDWSTNWYDEGDKNTGDNYEARTNVAITAGARLDFGTIGIHAGYTFGLTDNYKSAAVSGSYNRFFVGLNYNL